MLPFCHFCIVEIQKASWYFEECRLTPHFHSVYSWCKGYRHLSGSGYRRSNPVGGYSHFTEKYPLEKYESNYSPPAMGIL